METIHTCRNAGDAKCLDFDLIALITIIIEDLKKMKSEKLEREV